MALFVFIGHDVADSHQQRTLARPSHLVRLNALNDEGRLIMAGFMPHTHGAISISGSIIIADFADLQAAKAWADGEPYVHFGVYSHLEVHPFVQVLP